MHYLEYNENTTHGTQDFPLAFYHVDREHPRYEMPFHWHKELEIIHIVSGELTLYLNDEITQAREDDYIFINQGVLHGGTPDGCVYECIVFDPLALLMPTDACRRSVRFLMGNNTYIRSFYPADTQPFCNAAAQLFKAAAKKGPGSELCTLGALFTLFGILYEFHYYEEKHTSAVPAPERSKLLKPVLEYIDQSYMLPITLEDLAKLSGMSPRYFCRFFQAFIHRTPIDYLNYYRVERACLLLTSSPITITETAFLCGFNDSSYFVKIFKKYKGITPKQYQKL